MIPGIILAAGASSRMGRPKALLYAGDRTFVSAILGTFREAGVPSVVVVVRPGDAALVTEIENAGFGRVVENPRPEEGQLSSLLTGLDASDGPAVEGVLVTLVDVPLVSARTIRALLERTAASDAPILRATHLERHGHPVIFKRAVFDALRRADPREGARAVMRTVQVEDVEVADPGVAEDVDTAADYERLRGMLRP
jgi:CTP:molybdopterin cytidylyltransferase MocA